MSNSKDISNIQKKTCAVIPFYNEEENLHKVLSETSKYVHFIFAVDDGSNDNWRKNQLFLESIKYISLGKNYGKGKALRIGFEEAISSGYENIITLDADFQHDPKLIPDMLDGLKKNDFVIGNRLYDLKSMPVQRRMSNRLTSFILSKKTNQKILDSQCGFRAYSSKLLQSVKTSYNGFEAESEIIVKATRKGFKIRFVDIPTIYGTEKSKMKALKAIIGFIKVMFI